MSHINEVQYMENSIVNKQSGSHELKLNCREKGSLTGIEKVVSSCDTALNLISSCGNILISGEKLKITRYNAGDGILEFEGSVNSIKYSGAKQPLIKRIFK